MTTVIPFQRPAPPPQAEPVTVILRPSFSITAVNGSMDVRVTAQPRPAASVAQA